ncbi:MAG: hypothetical protein Q9187_008578 [Circinaria calcarea]
MLGEIYNSLAGIYMLGGMATRTPGDYYRIDPTTGNPTSKPLRNTNEYVHPSVRSRVCLDGPGYDDNGYYDPKAMRDYKLRDEPLDAEGKPQLVCWESRSRFRNKTRRILPESPLWETERKLLSMSPKIYAYLLGDQRRPH